MKSLAGSSSNLFLLNSKKLYYRTNICCTIPTQVCPNRKQKSHSFACPQQLQPSFSPRFSVSVLSSSHVQTELQQEDNAGDETILETVRVKFELQRECLFGQHFFLVGDDPTFGSWDPSEAIPLTWSDGHIWYVELDTCVGKSFKYKFILNQGDGTILWQPGEDRVLETFQTAKTIKVTDRWDNIEPEVVEEETSTGLFEQIVVNSDMQLVAENLTNESEYHDDDTDKVSRDDEETSSMPVKMLSSENYEEKREVEVVTDRVESDLTKNKLPRSHSSGEIDENMLSKAKTNGIIDYCEEFPVLVPGLIPLPITASEEPEEDKIEENALVADLYHEPDIIEELNMPELCGSSQVMQSLEDEFVREYRDTPGPSTATSNSNAVHDVENTQPSLQNDTAECDFQWGKKTLQKILMTLGLFLY